MNLRFDHVALTVTDLAASLAWYQNMLGGEVEHQADLGSMKLAMMRLGEARVELFCFDQTLPLPEAQRDLMTDLHQAGTKHMCLRVDDLTVAMDELRSKGVVFATEVDTAAFGGRYVFIQDPDGVLIELYQP